jgi:hypothetical protein
MDKWQEYERRKKKLGIMDPNEYQQAIQDILRALGL